MVRTRSFTVLALVAVAAFASACSEDGPNAPTAPAVLAETGAPRAAGGVTDPLIVPVGLTGTWKGTLVAAYLPVGYERWEFKVTQLTDTSFYATARVIVPQTDGSSFTTSNIATWGKNVGSSVSMRVYIGNAADFTGTLSADGRSLTGSWLYGVIVPGLKQGTGTLSLAR